jgi:hypothetical protein
MATGVVVREWQARAEQAERALLRAQEAAEADHRRAELAEKSARDAWAFARLLLRRGGTS